MIPRVIRDGGVVATTRTWQPNRVTIHDLDGVIRRTSSRARLALSDLRLLFGMFEAGKSRHPTLLDPSTWTPNQLA